MNRSGQNAAAGDSQTVEVGARRRVPLQARGQATVTAILDATAVLIEEVGPEAVTTNLIASAAKVNIATLYQYFSNKQSILLALFHRQMAERSEAGANRLTNVQPGKSWREAVADAINGTARMRALQRGSAAIRLAVRLSPDLQQHDRLDSLQSAQVVADMLVRLTDMDQARAMTIGRVGIEITSAVLDMWSFEADPDDRTYVDEAIKAVIAYLAPYLEPNGELP